MKNKNFKSEMILNKKFSTEISGYNATEVDEFFDKIIEDYNTHESIENSLREQIEDKNQIINLKNEEIRKLSIEIQNTKNQLKQTGKATNVELMRAIKEINKKMDSK